METVELSIVQVGSLIFHATRNLVKLGNIAILKSLVFGH